MGKGKDKYSNNPLYQKAIYYQQQVKSLNRELAIIDEALAEIQVERISDEIRNETKTTPLWEKWFKITKKRDTKEYFAAPSYYECEKAISLSEAEFMFLRGFKASRIEEINKQIQELSKQISED